MNQFNPFRALLWTSALGGLAALSVGCVITVGSIDCSECGNTGCNSQVVNGECKCDNGYEFAEPNPNIQDYECIRTPGKGGDVNCGGEPNVHREGEICVCDGGFSWCDPNNLEDLSCCVDDNQVPGDTDTDSGMPDPSTTTGTTTDAVDTTVDESGDPGPTCEMVETPWNGVEPDPADCTDDSLLFCSNTEQEGPAGSRYWICTAGEWVESPEILQEDCEFQGFVRSLGCTDNGVDVGPVCSNGPGTPCSGPECDLCDGSDTLEFCLDGFLEIDSCLRICVEDGDAQGVTYDHGFCSTDTGIAECICCDAGDDGCPV